MKNRSRGRSLKKMMTRISTWMQGPSRRSMGMKKKRNKREAMKEAMKERKNRTEKRKHEC